MLRYLTHPIAVGLAVLSLLTMMSQTFDLQFTQFVEDVLSEYKAKLGWLFGWIEPPIQRLVAALGSYFRLDLQLADHWRHVAVVSLLYYRQDIRGFWFAGDARGSLILAPWALTAWLASAAASGLIAFQSAYWTEFCVAAAPMVGFLIYFFGRSIYASIVHTEHQTSRLWDFLRRNYYNGKDVAAGFVILGAGLLVPFVWQLSSPGLALLLLLVLLFALRHVARGWVRSVATSERSKLVAFAKHGNTALGFSIVLSFVVTAAVIAFSLR